MAQTMEMLFSENDNNDGSWLLMNNTGQPEVAKLHICHLRRWLCKSTDTTSSFK